MKILFVFVFHPIFSLTSDYIPPKLKNKYPCKKMIIIFHLFGNLFTSW